LDTSERHRPNAAWPILAIALVTATILYFWRITEVGLSHWDEYYFTDTAKRILSIKGSEIHPWDPLVHPSLVALFFRFFGIHDYVAIATSATFAILTVFAIYVFGSKMYGRRTGALAALLLSSIEYYVIYSRMALSDITFAFFFTVSLLVYYISFQRQKLILFAIAGFLTALCIGAKYNGFQPLIIAAIYFIARHCSVPCFGTVCRSTPRGRPAAKDQFKRLTRSIEFKGLVVAGSVLAILSFFALAYLGSTWLYHGLVVPPDFFVSNFVRSLIVGRQYFFNVIWANKAGYLQPGYFNPFYLRALSTWVSPLVLVLSTLGVAHSLRRRESGGIFLSISVLFLLSYFSFMSYTYPRVLLPALPPLALLSARGLIALDNVRVPFIDKLPSRMRKAKLTSLCLIAVMFSSLYLSTDTISSCHNAYRMAGQFLNNRLSGNDIVWIDSQPVILFYLNTAVCSWEKQDILKGRYILVDFVAAARGDLPWILEIVESRGMKLVAEYPNPVHDVVLLNWLSFEKMSQTRHSPSYNTIRIYASADNATSTA